MRYSTTLDFQGDVGQNDGSCRTSSSRSPHRPGAERPPRSARGATTSAFAPRRLVTLVTLDVIAEDLLGRPSGLPNAWCDRLPGYVLATTRGPPRRVRSGLLPFTLNLPLRLAHHSTSGVPVGAGPIMTPYQRSKADPRPRVHHFQRFGHEPGWADIGRPGEGT